MQWHWSSLLVTWQYWEDSRVKTLDASVVGSSDGLNAEQWRAMVILTSLSVLSSAVSVVLKKASAFWDKSTNGAANVKIDESALDVVAKMAQHDKEDIQVGKAKEEGLDVLREGLCAERNTMAALETELENERNAAAIATSEAMAMISRLQEENSAMQLEVAQLQRMAEEKAEYDEYAMALLKEIVFKREA
ncbi:hypothetical protein L7F22_037995 [Adiantum nelumboides]|nr:hypothetical protein [Adiantum nelumboides]